MTSHHFVAMLLCGVTVFALNAQNQAVSQAVGSAPDNSVSASLDRSVANSAVNAAVGSRGSTSSGGSGNGQSDQQQSMDFQSSGKVKYFGYTEGGSVEMSSSSGELTAASRLARIAVRTASQNSSGPHLAAPSNSSSLTFSIGRTGSRGLSSIPTAGMPHGSARENAAGLSLVVKASNGPALLKIPLGAKGGLGGSAPKGASLGGQTFGVKAWKSASSKAAPHSFGAAHVSTAARSSASHKAKPHTIDPGQNPYRNSNGTEAFGSLRKLLIP